MFIIKMLNGLVRTPYSIKERQRVGGGIGYGGSLHAGHSHWKSLITPAPVYIDQTGISHPSKYANIVTAQDIQPRNKGRLGSRPFNTPRSFGPERDNEDKAGGSRGTDPILDDPEPTYEFPEVPMNFLPIFPDVPTGDMPQLPGEDDENTRLNTDLTMDQDGNPEYMPDWTPPPTPVFENMDALMSGFLNPPDLPQAGHNVATLPGSYPESNSSGGSTDVGPQYEGEMTYQDGYRPIHGTQAGFTPMNWREHEPYRRPSNFSSNTSGSSSRRSSLLSNASSSGTARQGAIRQDMNGPRFRGPVPPRLNTILLPPSRQGSLRQGGPQTHGRTRASGIDNNSSTPGTARNRRQNIPDVTPIVRSTRSGRRYNN